MNRSNAKKPFHEEFAEKIIEQLQEGTAPWQKPWEAGEFNFPLNPVSDTKYKGVNVMALASKDYNDPRWMSFKQANEEGFKVRKGEKSQTVIYYQFTTEQNLLDDDNKPKLDIEVMLKSLFMKNLQKRSLNNCKKALLLGKNLGRLVSLIFL